MVSDRKGSVTSEEPTSSSDPGDSSLEGPAMVPNLAGDAVQLSSDCILQWGDTTSLSLKLYTYKLVMLMSLVRPSRSADLASLCIR